MLLSSWVGAFTLYKMGKKTIIFGASAVLWLAVLYQWVLKDILFITLGVGRTHQTLEEFPFNCRRMHSPLLESCEDMVLDAEGRTLFAACSSISSRRGWSPGYVSWIMYTFTHLYDILIKQIGGTNTTFQPGILKITCQSSTSISQELMACMACGNSKSQGTTSPPQEEKILTCTALTLKCSPLLDFVFG